MKLSLAIASPDDAAAIVAVRNEASLDLTAHFGEGHWSNQVTEKGVKYEMTAHSKVLIAKQGGLIAGTLRLTAKKPWAIDPDYFTKVVQPVYLVDMAVHPRWQRKGIGSYLLQEAKTFAVSWLAQSIRLDAYDNPAGAGEFYRKCGFTERGRVVFRKNPLIYFELLV